VKSLFGFFFSILSLFLFVSGFSSAQQWSDEQKAVWAGVEAYWMTSTSENPADFLNYFDDSYYGWNYESETPHIKADVQKSINYWIKKGKSAYYTITPARIWVKGDFAYVHYYYVQVFEDSQGKPTTEKGRYTDILMKKENKWIMVGDHGGKTSK